MANNVVPFGKYKGQPVEAMAADRGYVDWLLAQSWFKDKHQNIYTLIINNFVEPSETPEHNALQALFLDNVFVEKVISIHYGEVVYTALWGWPDGHGEFGVAFEVRGADVYIAFCDEEFVVEIKPSVGDDYPAILRQIKNIQFKGRKILFLESYVGAGATREQFIEIFNRSGIKVVFREDAVAQPERGQSLVKAVCDRVNDAAALFDKVWRTTYTRGRQRLLDIDLDLHKELDAQSRLLSEAIREGDDEQIRIHGEAMLRGWAAANRRMEDAEIEKAKAALPGAVVRIREK